MKKHFLITCSISCRNQQGVLQALRWPNWLIFGRSALVSLSAVVWKTKAVGVISCWKAAWRYLHCLLAPGWFLPIALGQGWPLILSPLEYFGPGFLKQWALTTAPLNDRIRGHTAQSRSSAFDKPFGKSVGQNLREQGQSKFAFSNQKSLFLVIVMYSLGLRSSARWW